MMIEVVQSFLEINVALSSVIAIVLRTASIVIAPMPGIPLDFVNLALFGKMKGFIYAESSLIIGSSINFWIARKFGRPFVEKFIPLEKIDLWQRRIDEKSGVGGLILIRFMTVSIFDYLSYVVGLTKMNFGKFLFTSIVASIPPMAAFFYFGGLILETEILIATFFIVPFTILLIMFYKGKIFTRFSEYLSIKEKIDRVNTYFNNTRR